MEGYRVVRFFRDHPNGLNRSGRRNTVIARCTLAEAQAHCQDPETSSSTCKLPVNMARTRRCGPWFDGYEAR